MHTVSLLQQLEEILWLPMQRRNASRRNNRRRRGVSTVVGTLFFIMVVFIFLTVTVIIFNSFNGYVSSLKAFDERSIQNKETNLSIPGMSFQTPSPLLTGPSTIGTSTSQAATSYSGEEKVLYAQ